METGSLSGFKSVGGGVWDRRMHAGPGYRIHCGRDGEALVMLGGGTKEQQSWDIEDAGERW